MNVDFIKRTTGRLIQHWYLKLVSAIHVTAIFH